MKIKNFKINSEDQVILKITGEVLRAFHIEFANEYEPIDYEDFEIVNSLKDDTIKTTLTVVTENNEEKVFTEQDNINLAEKRGAEIHRIIKKNLYKILTDNLKLEGVPYGIMHGVRPTKIVHRWIREGFGVTSHGVIDKDRISRRLRADYLTSYNKSYLLTEVAVRQIPILNSGNNRTVGIYVGIPFCVTRCLYCSFPSNILPNDQRVDEFMEALTKDINAAQEEIKRYGFKVQSIYIGGGTPTALPENFFEEMMREVTDAFYSPTVEEFTVECGRPDTITAEKISVMVDCKVTRVSVNPQSMKQETLDKIGRQHSVSQIFTSYNALRRSGNFKINMDLILGLPGENLADVKDSLEKVLALNPDDITLHALAIKRGSPLQIKLADEGIKIEEFELPEDKEVRQMAELAEKMLRDKKYLPYYLYRQGYISGQIENIGYCKRGSEGIYNIQIMDERQTILGVGVAATTKVPDNENLRLQTSFNAKDLTTYLRDVDRYIDNRKNTLAEIYTHSKKVKPVEEFLPLAEMFESVEGYESVEEPEKVEEPEIVEEIKPVKKFERKHRRHAPARFNKDNIEPVEEVKPAEEIKSIEDIETTEEFETTEDVAPAEEFVAAEVVPVEDVEPVEEVKPFEDVESSEEIKPAEEFVAAEVVPVEDVEAVEEVKPFEDVESSEEIKPAEEFETTEDIESDEVVPVEDVETAKEIKPIRKFGRKHIRPAPPRFNKDKIQPVEENAETAEEIQSFENVEPVEEFNKISKEEIFNEFLDDVIENSDEEIEYVEEVEEVEEIEPVEEFKSVEDVETDEEIQPAENVETAEEFESAATVENIESVEEIETDEDIEAEEVKPVRKFGRKRVRPAPPRFNKDKVQPEEEFEDDDDTEPAGELKSVEDVETAEEIKPVEEFESAATVENIESVEEIETDEDIEPKEVKPVRKFGRKRVRPAPPRFNKDKVQPVEEFEDVDDTEPAEEFKSVEDVETDEEIQPAENVETAEEFESAATVENIESVEEIETDEDIEPEEVKPVRKFGRKHRRPAPPRFNKNKVQPEEEFDDVDDTEPAEEFKSVEDVEPVEEHLPLGKIFDPEEETKTVEEPEAAEEDKTVEETKTVIPKRPKFRHRKHKRFKSDF